MEKELVVSATLEEVNSISKRLVVEVPAELLDKSIKAAMASLKKDAKVPGFRPGKVPDEMMRTKLGHAYHEEVLRQIVRDTYPQAVELTGAKPISDPRIETAAAEIDATKPLTYKVVFEVYPTVEAKGYEGLKLERGKVHVTSDEVEQELKHLQRQLTQLEPAPDAAVEKGILARVDFKGTADGKPFDGCEASDFIIDLDAGNILAEFEQHVVGMKEKEERDIEFLYPADYFNKEIAGKHAKFHIVVKELRRKVMPELDDNFAKDLGQFKTLDDVRKIVHNRIGEVKEHGEVASMQRQVIEQLVKNQPVDVPDAMISRELGFMLEELSHELEREGRTLEDAGINAENFVRNHLEEARFRVRGHVLVNAIAEKEKIDVTDQEIEAQIAAIAAQAGEPVAKVRKQFEEKKLIPGLKSQMIAEKTLNFVIGKANIKERSSKKEKK